LNKLTQMHLTKRHTGVRVGGGKELGEVIFKLAFTFICLIWLSFQPPQFLDHFLFLTAAISQ